MAVKYALLCILVFLCSISADSVERYNVEGLVRLPRGKGSKPSATRVRLNGGLYTGIVRANSSFSLQDVPAGNYLLEIHNTDYTFHPVRVDVGNKERGKIRAQTMHRNDRLPYPLILRPVVKTTYFQVIEPFNVWSYLKSPMVIMLIVMVGMVVIMPRMVNNMSEDDKEEMKRMQSKMKMPGM